MGAKETITQIYVGYYDRAPDPVGLQYWIGRLNDPVDPMTVAQIAQSFSVQAESTAKYPYLVTPDVISPKSFINDIYQNLFNRAPDTEGEAYWLAQLAGGTPVGEMIIDIISGAKDDDTAKDKTTLDNKVAVGIDWAEEVGALGGIDYENNPEAMQNADDVLNNVTDDPQSVEDAKNETDDFVRDGGGTGASFILTDGTDAGAAFAGGVGKDDFHATEKTLTSSDAIDGGDGDKDELNYASSGAGPVTEAGFTAKNIETFNITSDATGGTTFDMTGVEGVWHVNNTNSSQDLMLTGGSNTGTFGVDLRDVSGGDTTINFAASAVSGSDDDTYLGLNRVHGTDNSAQSAVTFGAGLETIKIGSWGGNDTNKLTSLNAGGAKTINIEGGSDLEIGGTLTGVETINLAMTADDTMTGDFTAKVDSGGTTKDVVVTGGKGDDSIDFSNGFEAGDSFDGGEGTDTIGLTQTVASGALGGALSNVEQLSIKDAGTGTIDMDNFAGVSKVIYDAGITANGTATVDDAVSGISVEVDVANLVATDADLTVDLKTDGTADEVSLVFDAIGAGEGLNVVTVDDAETLNVSVDDDTTDGTGTLTVANLVAGDATKVVLTGDADVTLGSGTTKATEIDASGMTGNLSVSNLSVASTGTTIKLGSGKDSLNTGTGTGADTVTLGGGADKIVYTNVNQSSGTKVDTVTDFVSGTDVVDLKALGVVSSTQFKGTFADFGSAQGALSGTGTQAVFQANFDGNGNGKLWVDTGAGGGFGTLDAADFQVILNGVSTLTAADLGLGVGVTFTAKTANTSFQTNDGANDAVEGKNVTNEDDTINATAAQLSNAATVVDGLLGTDVLNVSGTGTANVSGNGGFTNVEEVNLSKDTDGLTIDAADISTTQVSKITGDAVKAQTLSVVHNGNDGDLTDLTVRNVGTVNFNGNDDLAVDEDTLTDVTALNLTTAGGDLHLEANGTGIFDFSSIALSFTNGGSEILDLDNGTNAKTVTVDAADLTNVDVIAGESSAVVTTLNINDTASLGSLTVTNIDTVKIGTTGNTNQTLTVDGNDFTATNFTTVTGSGDDNLTTAGDTGVTFVNSTVSGIDVVDVSASSSNRTITIDQASFSGDVTLVGHSTVDLSITEGGDYSNLTLNGGDFDDIDLATDATAAVVDTEFFGGAITNIDGNGGTVDAMTVNMSGTTLDLGAIDLGTGADVALVVNGTAGNDIITAVDVNAAGSTLTINLSSGGNDVVRLEDNSGNATDALVVADAVSITGFDTANDQINVESALVSSGGVVSRASGSADENTDGIVFINNATIADFSNIGQITTAIGNVANATNGEDMVFAISNNAGTQTAIYSVEFAGADAVVDATDAVTLVGVVAHTGTFDTTDINVF